MLKEVKHACHAVQLLKMLRQIARFQNLTLILNSKLNDRGSNTSIARHYFTGVGFIELSGKAMPLFICSRTTLEKVTRECVQPCALLHGCYENILSCIKVISTYVFNVLRV